MWLIYLQNKNHNQLKILATKSILKLKGKFKNKKH